MNIRILLSALESYAASAECSAEDRPAVFEAIKSCAAVSDRMLTERLLNIDSSLVSIIPKDLLADVLLRDTFVIYERLASSDIYKSLNEVSLRATYIDECRKIPFIAQLTNEQLQFGFEIAASQWYGMQDPDDEQLNSVAADDEQAAE